MKASSNPNLKFSMVLLLRLFVKFWISSHLFFNLMEEQPIGFFEFSTKSFIKDFNDL